MNDKEIVKAINREVKRGIECAGCAFSPKCGSAGFDCIISQAADAIERLTAKLADCENNKKVTASLEKEILAKMKEEHAKAERLSAENDHLRGATKLALESYRQVKKALKNHGFSDLDEVFEELEKIKRELNVVKGSLVWTVRQQDLEKRISDQRKQLEKVQGELLRVKREKDAAVRDIRVIISNSDELCGCDVCAHVRIDETCDIPYKQRDKLRTQDGRCALWAWRGVCAENSGKGGGRPWRKMTT